SLLKTTVLPFIVSGSKSTLVSSTSFIKAPADPLAKEKDTKSVYTRHKPIGLYKKLLEIFCADKTLHSIDACSGAGSCGLTCADEGLKCLIVDECDVKIRLIKQRLQL
ncbi:Hypothetical predicted protein, partial [Paramuricea clavata]